MFWFLGCEACRILASRPGIEPASLALEVFTTGPPGKSLCFTFCTYLIICSFPTLLNVLFMNFWWLLISPHCRLLLLAIQVSSCMVPSPHVKNYYLGVVTTNKISCVVSKVIWSSRNQITSHITPLPIPTCWSPCKYVMIKFPIVTLVWREMHTISNSFISWCTLI